MVMASNPRVAALVAITGLVAITNAATLGRSPFRLAGRIFCMSLNAAVLY